MRATLLALLAAVSTLAAPQANQRPPGETYKITYNKDGKRWYVNVPQRREGDFWNEPVNGDELSSSTESEWYVGHAKNVWFIDLENGGGYGPITLNTYPPLCIDAGLSPTAGTKLKVWQCYNGVPQQTWQVIGGNRFKLANKNLCFDLTDGKGPSIQLWDCIDWNTNQVWNLVKGPFRL